ncbi:MAG: hypothetical protein ACREH5_02745, partial [Candidatus Omnitrophota bacterium]
ATAGWAYTDFYGVKMRSVSNAEGLLIEPTPDNSLKVTHDANTMDDRVRAWGRLQHTGTGRSGVVKITVENLSDKPILADLSFAEFSLVMTNGDRHELKPPMLFGAPEEILPGKKAAFSPTFGALMIKQADVRMIVCSFDMGETIIALVPRPYTKPVKKSAKPVVKKEAVKLVPVPSEPQKRFVPQGKASPRMEDRGKPSLNNFALPKKDRRKKYVR